MIKMNKAFANHLFWKIEDSGIHVEVDSKLTENEYVGIKVDNYYNGLHMARPPKAVDFVVAVDCECDWYALYILELKGVSKPSSPKDIQEKFDTTFSDFMGKRFKDIFHNSRFKYRDVFLYLVTTAYEKAVQGGNYERFIEIRNKMRRRDSLCVDDMLSQKPYYFRGKYYYIKKEVPPNPLIRRLL